MELLLTFIAENSGAAFFAGCFITVWLYTVCAFIEGAIKGHQPPGNEEDRDDDRLED